MAPALKAATRWRRCSNSSRIRSRPTKAPPSAPCCAATPSGSSIWAAAIERADNSARLLDVKYHLLLPRGESVGGSLDYFQWTTILRTVSAMTAYRWVYRDSVKPWLVADLLILNRQIPRSLAACYDEILRHLDLLACVHGKRGPAHRLAAAGHSKLTQTNIDRIFSDGLHEFLTRFITDNNKVGDAIAEQYLF